MRKIPGFKDISANQPFKGIYLCFVKNNSFALAQNYLIFELI